LKQHKPWFVEECVGILDQRKQAKILWIQDPSERNVDTLINVRRDTSRHFRHKKAYLKAKIEELEINSKLNNSTDLYRGIIDFKNGYQPRTDIIKMRKLICSRDPTGFWLGGRTVSPSFGMCMG
jgi:hypothetical protein